ncbi:hypothetical protein [Mucilaginibacter oryzae]|nr:hypothetical protein [Mucilaginibacter oryzae]
MDSFEAHLQLDAIKASYVVSWAFSNTLKLLIEPGIGDSAMKGSAIVEIDETTDLVFQAENDATQRVFNKTLVLPIPVIDEFRTVSSMILLGSPVNLSWLVRYASKITLKDFGEFSGLESAEIYPDRTCTITIIAENHSGSVSSNLQLELPLPEIKLFASDRDTVLEGEEVMLTWATINAAKLTLSGHGEPILLEGSQCQISINKTSVISIQAANPTGMVTKELLIKAVARPVVRSLIIDKPVALPGEEVMISWEVINYERLWLVLDETKVEVTDRTVFIFRAEKALTITLLCQSADKMITVKETTLLKIVDAAKVNFMSLDRKFTVQGQPVVLSWETSDASQINLLPLALPLSAKGYVTLAPATKTVYTIVAANERTEDRKSMEIEVLPLPLIPPLPISVLPVRIPWTVEPPPPEHVILNESSIWKRLKGLLFKRFTFGWSSGYLRPLIRDKSFVIKGSRPLYIIVGRLRTLEKFKRIILR